MTTVALADTSVWIQPPVDGFAAHADELAVSIVTIAELQYGVTARDPLEALTRRRRLQVVLDNYEVLPLDLPTVELYGVLAGIVRDGGRNPRPRRFDLLIAATAARHRMPLLTRDRDGFRGLEQVLSVIEVR